MSRVACETATTTGMVLVMGEITTKGYVDIQKIVRETVREIYCTVTCDFPSGLKYGNVPSLRTSVSFFASLCARDGKSQVTVQYDEEGNPIRLDAVVLSTQHDPDVTQELHNVLHKLQNGLPLYSLFLRTLRRRDGRFRHKNPR